MSGSSTPVKNDNLESENESEPGKEPDNNVTVVEKTEASVLELIMDKISSLSTQSLETLKCSQELGHRVRKLEQSAAYGWRPPLGGVTGFASYPGAYIGANDGVTQGGYGGDADGSRPPLGGVTGFASYPGAYGSANNGASQKGFDGDAHGSRSTHGGVPGGASNLGAYGSANNGATQKGFDGDTYGSRSAHGGVPGGASNLGAYGSANNGATQKGFDGDAYGSRSAHGGVPGGASNLGAYRSVNNGPTQGGLSGDAYGSRFANGNVPGGIFNPGAYGSAKNGATESGKGVSNMFCDPHGVSGATHTTTEGELGAHGLGGKIQPMNVNRSLTDGDALRNKSAGGKGTYELNYDMGCGSVDIGTVHNRDRRPLENVEAERNNVPYASCHIPMQPRKLIDLPGFSGEAEDWPVFFTMFSESSAAYGYTNLENLLRLQKCLKGAAKEEVKGLLINPANVNHIMDRLQFRYGRPELLIKSQMEMVNELSNVSENNLEKIVPFAAKVENLVIYLQSAGAVQYLQNPTLIEQLIGKLPLSKRIQWNELAKNIQPYPNLSHFSIWLSDIGKSVAKATLMATKQQVKGEQRTPQKTVMQTSKENFEQKDIKAVCYKCKGDHPFSKCDTYTKASVNDKWALAKELRLCYGCLHRGHSMMLCKFKRECKLNGCKKYHHRTLHKEQSKDSIRNEKIESPEATINTVKSCMSKILFKVVPVDLAGPNNKVIHTYAFLDEGSSASLINEKLAIQLGVDVDKTKLTLNWIGKHATDVMSMECNLRIRSPDGNKKWLRINGNTVPELQLPLQSVDAQELKSKFKKLKNVRITGYTDAEPMLLIGINNCHLVSAIKSVALDSNLVASKSALGWYVYGLTQKEPVHPSVHSVVLHSHIAESELEIDMHKMMTDYFSTESFGVKLTENNLESADVIRARKILQDTTKRLKGEYETGLLWAEDNIHFPESYNMALKRMYGVENKMRSQNKMEEYDQAVTDFVNKGYAVKLSREEASFVNSRTWYLPHFGVHNINKPKKMRLVFDAAAAIDGVSLNTKLLKGPDENPPLIKILFQFRQGKIAVCADIREMFLQVRVREADQQALRFLWRHGNPNNEVSTFKMRVMIFGAACSPCCAQYIKNLNAENATGNNEAVKNAIKFKHYVDDFVASFISESQAHDISSEVKQVHKKANFDLRGFVSNSKEVQDRLNGTEREHPNSTVQMDSEKIDKILGMYWDSQKDEFVFDLKWNRVDKDIVKGLKCPTKRQLLSLVMSVYDPFGMLADLMIAGKVLIQDVWRAGISWNDLIPDNLYVRFKQWISQLENVKHFRISRCYSLNFFDPNVNIELHVFVDASELAFASVAYWRIECYGRTEVRFVAGKTKCAPLKMLSIPRLELQAAVLGTRLKNTILACHDIKVQNSTLWSDSKTVISWIRSNHRLYKQFVAHRVSEILDTTDESNWRWVPTNLNAADKATKIPRSMKYIAGNIWTKGPEFLLKEKQFWPPTELEDNFEDEIERKKIVLTVHSDPFIDMNRYSQYLRLKRTMGWILRFVQRLRHRNEPEAHGELTSNELRAAETALCKIAQSQFYEQEIRCLMETNTISKSSSIYSLCPKLDAEGLLVVNGRLDYAITIPERARQPIIMPAGHILTRLIVKWYHTIYHHQNDELIVIEIRRKFWIVNLRAAVKRAKSNCQHCKNKIASPKPVLMGQLPKDRVTPYQRPFSYVGIDYFGPVMVTIGRRHEKRWVALFTCLTVRAIHLELAADLSTDACILCIRNFVNRRGVPIKIRSDMGTNFVGADNEIKKTMDLFEWDSIKAELANKGINWEFNCPSNPSSGGCWERLVRSTKRVLSVTLKEQAPQVETLRSLLIEAENIINSRPLTHVPVNIDDPEPLTPNHFLLGTTNSTQTPGDGGNFNYHKQYRIAKQLKDNFWRRWIREYLPTLTRRTKWFAPTKPIQIGDVAIICEENQPRGNWKKGIIVKTIPSKDGQIRIAEVKTSTGILRRPVSKLAVLDVLGKTPG